MVMSTAKYVQNTLAEESTGHDWWHVYRVWKTALNIAKHEEGADLFIVQLAALLHDIADWKFHGSNSDMGVKTATAWLNKIDADKETIERVCYIIKNISFKGANVRNKMNSKEGRIVQDADRLDAIGAIGIARTFAYGGYKNVPIYNPEVKPKYHQTFASYKASNSPTINHFYEKLLLLKDRMNTKTGKRLAEERDVFMRTYLKKFFREWEGKE